MKLELTEEEINNRINALTSEIETKQKEIQLYKESIHKLKEPKLDQLYYFKGTQSGSYINYHIYKVTEVDMNSVMLLCINTGKSVRMDKGYITGKGNPIEMFPAPDIAKYIQKAIKIDGKEYKVEGIFADGNIVKLSENRLVSEIVYEPVVS